MAPGRSLLLRAGSYAHLLAVKREQRRDLRDAAASFEGMRVPQLLQRRGFGREMTHCRASMRERNLETARN